MRAIILAAGRGTRLRSHTESLPKCMVHFQGKPILEYILETMRCCNIANISIVTGYKRECISYPGLTYYYNPHYATTNMVSTLFCAEQEMTSDILISYGDIIYTPTVLRALIESDADFAVCVDTAWEKLWRARMSDPLADAETMKINEHGNIIELGKRAASLKEINGQYMGLLKISGRVLPAVREFYHSLSRSDQYDGQTFENMYLTSFIQRIIDRLMPVTAVLVRGGWIEIDCASDLALPFEWCAA